MVQIQGNTESNESNEKIMKYHYEPRTFKNCFPEIGCVDTNEDWYHQKYRPINMEPLDRHTIRTEFLLLHNINSTQHSLIYDLISLKNVSMEHANFKTGDPVIFLIHDFTSNGETGWIKHIAEPLIDKHYNVISVDWESGAEPPYAQAIANARVVALEIVALSKMLEKMGRLSPDRTTLIGHGVGAHIAGYVGKCIKGIKKIVALDPTGPSFSMMPCKVKLTRRDAQYVEVLHTDAYHDR